MTLMDYIDSEFDKANQEFDSLMQSENSRENNIKLAKTTGRIRAFLDIKIFLVTKKEATPVSDDKSSSSLEHDYDPYEGVD